MEDLKKTKRYHGGLVQNFIMTFALVMFNHETFPSRYFPGSIKTILLITIMAVLFTLYRAYAKNFRLGSSVTKAFLLLFALIFITSTLNLDFGGGHFYIALSLAIGFMYVHLIPFDEFSRLYVRIIAFLAVYSLVTLFLLRPFLQNVPDMIFPRFLNSAGGPFINARFSYIYNVPGYYRNFGIFREPGVYQVFLNFALFLELFSKNSKPKIVTITILCLTIVSTFSLPGYLTALLILFSFAIYNKRIDDSLKLSIHIYCKLVFFVGTVLFVTVLYMGNTQFSLFLNENIKSLLGKGSSYEGRVISIYASLDAWTTSPLFGHGLIKGLTEIAMETMQTMTGSLNVHHTSTIGALLATFGLVFTGLYSYCMYNIFKVRQFRVLGLIVFIAILISINTQSLIYNELIYTFILYGAKYQNNVVATNPFIKNQPHKK